MMRYDKYQMAVYSIIIIVVSFCFFVIPYSYMGYDSDAFGLVFFSSQLTDWWSIAAAMMRPIQDVYLPLNEVGDCTQGFLTYFRPGMTLFHALTYRIVGASPFAYFLINVALHTMTTVAVFHIVATVIRRQDALVLALVFLIHPSLIPSYVGVLSHIVPTYLFLAAGVIFLVRWYHQPCALWNMMASGCILLSMLCYEIAIVAPIILVVFYLTCDRSQRCMDRCIRAAKASWMIWLTVLSYLAWRYYMLGGASASEAARFTLYRKAMACFENCHQAIKPFLGMRDMPALVVAMFVIIGMIKYLYVFMQCPERRARLFFYAAAFCLAAWPIFLVTADGRYFYPALPFFLLLMYEIVDELVTSKMFRYALWSVILLWCGYSSSRALAARSYVTRVRDHALEELIHHDVVPGTIPSSYILLGTLHCYAHDTLIMQQGMMQALRVLSHNPQLEVYHITEAKIVLMRPCGSSFVITREDHPRLGRGYRFQSFAPADLFMLVPRGWREHLTIPYSMGTIVVNHLYDGWKTDDITFFIDKIWLRDGRRIVTFDVSKFLFISL